MTGAPLLEIEDLTVVFPSRVGDSAAVSGFSLHVQPGEAVGLVGESGCGKSTVAHAIMRYLGPGRVAGGAIRYRGRDMATLGPDELRRVRGREIAMVYQEPATALNPSLTIERQLTEVPLTHEPGCSRQAARAKALAMLAEVRLPDAERIMTAYPHQLSGGQQQRVVIAMALLARPALLLLDEPTTALDVTIEAGIVALVKELARRTGTALIFISHNLGLILDTCDRVAVMYSGEVVEEASVRALFRRPRHPYTRALFDCLPAPGMDKTRRPLTPIRGQPPLPGARPPGCNFGPRCNFFVAGRCDMGSIPLKRTDEAGHARCVRVKEIDWRQRFARLEPQRPVTIGEAVLSVEGLSKDYSVRDRAWGLHGRSASRTHIRANDALSFKARRGETVAVVGESGCGKSTFARILAGLESASGGRVILFGEDVARIPAHKRSAAQRAALQMVFQNPDGALNPSLSIGSQIERAVRKLGRARSRATARKEVLRLLDLVKLPHDFVDRLPRQLSGGQKQRVGIARAFAGNPGMVIADEAVSALDVSVQAAVIDVLTAIQRESGTTMIFISHDLGLVQYVADWVAVMYLGQIIEQGSAGDVFEPPYHPYTEALLSAAPVADMRLRRKRIILDGAPPSALDPPAGCPFHTRCPRKLGRICEREKPPLQRAARGHRIACHIPLDTLRGVEPVVVEAAE